MKLIILFLPLILLNSCSFPKAQSASPPVTLETPSPVPSNTSVLENSRKQDLIENLLNAPKLVHYGEDGARDDSVLRLSQIGVGETTNAPVREVADIVALREKAIPLLIEHLDDTRPSAATFDGGYISDNSPPVKVPVGHVCLDILLNLVDSSFYHDKNCEIETRMEGCITDGFYFRPDDYWIVGRINKKGENNFLERPIVRIVKANWQKAYREGRLKYDFKITWK